MMYREYLRTKNLNALAKKIQEKCEGKLTLEQIVELIQNLNFNINYDIVVKTNPEDFEQYITDVENISEHSWAGSTETRVHCTMLYAEGEFEMGYYKFYQYSNNGNLDSPDVLKMLCNFDTTKKYIALQEKYYNDTFNNNDIHEEEYTIAIYMPKNE